MKTIKKMSKIALFTYIIFSAFNLVMYYGFNVDVWNITLPLSFIFFFSLYLREFSDELNLSKNNKKKKFVTQLDSAKRIKRSKK